MNWEQRKIYVSGLVIPTEVKRRRGSDEKSRRQISLEYYLRKESDKLPVCKVMFLNTLCLGEWCVRSWSTNTSDGINKTLVKSPRVSTQQKQHTEARLQVRQFLTDLPKVPSHYCCASSSKMYLEPHFQSLAEVHRVLLDHNKSNTSVQVSRQTFNEEFQNMNIGLYQPKKDQCDTCCSFKVGNLSNEDYERHISKKDEARESHAADKRAAEEGKCDMFTMDVQAVQLIPYMQASALYFKQKLAVHNFTLFNVVTHEVVCYVWHEGEGEVTANVYASCIAHFIDNYTVYDKEIILYSDGCASQNRNCTLSNVLLSVAQSKNVNIIQKYLEKGHTQMECDSIHSVIERKKKNRELFTPAEFVQLIKEARPKQPYKVHYLSHDFFKDYSGLKTFPSIRPGSKVGDPTVCDLRCLMYTPDGQIKWQTNHNGNWNILLKQRRCVSSAQCKPVKQLYSSPLSIRKEKFQDLQSLKSVVPTDFHPFFDNLQFK